MKKQGIILFILALFYGCCQNGNRSKSPVDWVNPYMGNISHLLVPTFPTIHLPNSMLRVYPERSDFTGDLVRGLPLIVTSHRSNSSFNFCPVQGSQDNLMPYMDYSYDNEVLKPYYYEVILENFDTNVKFAPSHRSAVYQIDFSQDTTSFLVVNSRNGALKVENNIISGYQEIGNQTRVYLWMEIQQKPDLTGVVSSKGGLDGSRHEITGENSAVAVGFPAHMKQINLRYGVSFISEEQARENMNREIADYDLKRVADVGRTLWNNTLSKIEVKGATEDQMTVFYTSLYRCYERPICISEYGRYYSAFDHKIHEDNGTQFYTDDWIWDTYRATHPLRLLTDADIESDIINSFLCMAQQMEHLWMPTFPEVTGDSRRMNSNHGVATIADAYSKGLRSFDLQLAYDACRGGIEEKTLAPWSGAPAGWLDDFYKEHGYIPALEVGEEENVPEVHHFEKRQPVAVTLGTAYDEWCLSRIAGFLGLDADQKKYQERSYNYRNLYNSQTGFFHPKDKEGRFIEPFDYKRSGGMGARLYYGENNGWVYRWDVQHNIADLISLMGGNDRFNENLDQTFRESLGSSKFEFYSQLPDHTGNVGQFSMANEPSLHIPYLYNYSGRPWMTQKRIRTLLDQWFRNDLMGVPGDEDGGGMSAFVVFSMMGFYPVTPGLPIYNIGSPSFQSVKLKLTNGKYFEIIAQNCSKENKYIQSAKLNGKNWNRAWFNHTDLADGGKLELIMGNRPNKKWGAAPDDIPPSGMGLE